MAGVSGGNLWSSESRGLSSLFLQSGAADLQPLSAEMGNFSWGLDVPPNSAPTTGQNHGTTNDLFANLGGEVELGDSSTLLDSSAFVDPHPWNQTLMRSRGGESVQNMEGNLNEGFFNGQKEVPSEWEMRNFAGEETSFSTTSRENGFSHFNSSGALSDIGSPILERREERVMSQSISGANRFGNGSVQLAGPLQFGMGSIKQECSEVDQFGTTLISQGLDSDGYSKQDIMSGMIESSANRPFLKGMAYDNGQAFMQREDHYPGLSWPPPTTFPISLSQILPTSSQSIPPLNTNRNSPLWDLIFSKSDTKPHHAIQNFQHLGLDKRVQMNRITQNLTKCHVDEGRDCSSETGKRCSNESSSTSSDAIFKRPRLDTTPCPMPFKVRKEKLGDRITALQQLVSPFGKTDTASVLLEAIAYIKFLHDQVQVLSTPYMNNGGANSGEGGETVWGEGSCEGNDSEGGRKDLRSRGLCLVPVSATLSVTNDNGADYWSPALGCNYR